MFFNASNCRKRKLGGGRSEWRSGDRLDPTAPEQPFNFHLDATEQDDTRDRQSIEHSEKRL